jgi:hypothetical protein
MYITIDTIIDKFGRIIGGSVFRRILENAMKIRGGIYTIEFETFLIWIYFLCDSFVLFNGQANVSWNIDVAEERAVVQINQLEFGKILFLQVLSANADPNTFSELEYEIFDTLYSILYSNCVCNNS